MFWYTWQKFAARVPWHTGSESDARYTYYILGVLVNYLVSQARGLGIDSYQHHQIHEHCCEKLLLPAQTASFASPFSSN